MENRSISRKFEYCDLDKISYQEAWDLQKRVLEMRLKNSVSDTLFLLEHPHTYTLGKIADKNNLIYDEEDLKQKEITVFDIDRGGDITYHGPGQIVGYPIIDLKDWKKDTHLYLRNLEEVLIRTCADYGLKAGRKEKYTGVWLEDRKICAIGIKVSRWITMHGFAFNVNTDLNLFNGIVPCGIKEKEVTSLSKELNREILLEDVKDKIIKHFADLFGYDEYVVVEKEHFVNHV